MDGGDLITKNRPTRGGDLMTLSRQQEGGFIGLFKRLFGMGPGEMQKQMSDPTKLQQIVMQRGGFPWALAGLSLLPMLMGKGKADAIQKQMGTTRDPVMQRGGFSVPPGLVAKGLPLLKAIGIPLAMGALASVGDNAVDKIFGDGSGGRPTKSSRGIGGRRARSTSIRASRKQSRTTHTSKKRVRKTGRTRAAGKISKKTSRRGKAPARAAAAGSRRRHGRSKSGAPSSSFSSLWRRGKDVARDQLETSGRK